MSESFWKILPVTQVSPNFLTEGRYRADGSGSLSASSAGEVTFKNSVAQDRFARQNPMPRFAGARLPLNDHRRADLSPLEERARVFIAQDDTAI